MPINKDFWRLVDFKPDGYGNWLMLSTINCQSGNTSQTDWFLMKLDSSFNMLWYKQYGNSNLTDIASKIVAEPDGYLLTGGVNNNNVASIGFSYRAQIIKTDTSGNVKWLWQSNSSKKTNFIKDLIRTQDGGYVYCGQGDGYEYVNGSYGYMMWKGWVEKLDSNRNVVWNRSVSTLTSTINSNEQTVLKELLNGDIIMAGGVGGGFEPNDTVNRQFGSLSKISSHGNILWQRKFQSKDSFLHLFFDMKATSDGGFVLCGEARQVYYPYDPPTQRGWLVKVDSNGCLGSGDPQCWPTSINEISTEKKIVVYPNPVTDYFYISNKDGKSLTVIISDIAGRVLQEANSSALSVQLNMQQYSPGIYFYRIIGKEGLLLQGKLVKE